MSMQIFPSRCSLFSASRMFFFIVCWWLWHCYMLLVAMTGGFDYVVDFGLEGVL